MRLGKGWPQAADKGRGRRSVEKKKYSWWLGRGRGEGPKAFGCCVAEMINGGRLQELSKLAS